MPYGPLPYPIRRLERLAVADVVTVAVADACLTKAPLTVTDAAQEAVADPSHTSGYPYKWTPYVPVPKPVLRAIY